jgi:hypothetical protein
MSDIKKVAELSPGVATAALQSGASKNDINKLGSLVTLKGLHNELTALPQNSAYKKYNTLPKETQDALASLFSPKYLKEDKGFFRNIVGDVKSALWYGGYTNAKDIVKQVLNLASPTNLPKNVLKATVVGGKSFIEQTNVATPVGKVLETLVRPQNKLIKQPYTAARLSSADEGVLGQLGVYGSSLLEGAKELLPGGTDATVLDTSTNFMKYWSAASDQENAYDPVAVAQLDKEFAPEVAFVGKLLASKKDIVDAFDTYSNDPAVVGLIARWTAGDEEAKKVIGDAVVRYSKSKISGGRDWARYLAELLPYDMERAIKGSGPAGKLFDVIAGPVDFAVTFGLDPIIIGGKAKANVDAARFGLAKMAVNTKDLQKAWTIPIVKNYWDNAGELLEAYRSTDLATKGAALTRLRDRYKELSPDIIDDLAKAGVKDSNTALKYFTDNDILQSLIKGNAAYARTPLIPRYTRVRKIQDDIKDFAVKTLGTDRFVNTKALPDNPEEFAKLIDSSDITWADNIGLDIKKQKTLLGNEVNFYTPRDKSFAATADRVVRQLSIAPAADRLISISDASGADQVFKLVRAAGVSKSAASQFRAAWINAEEGQRLLMYKGMLKTIAVGMGLDHTEEGLKIIASIDDFSKELYSVNQSVLDLGPLGEQIGIVSSKGKTAPAGVRKAVQESDATLTAEGKGNRLAASLGAELRDLGEQLRLLRAAQKDAVANGMVDEAEAISQFSKIIGGRFANTKKAYKDVKGRLDKGEELGDEFEDLADAVDLTMFNAAEVNGKQMAIRQYQLSQKRALPNFIEWRRFAAHAGATRAVIGKVSDAHSSRVLTDAWSFLNLYPRLGIRTTIEELGTFGFIAGAEGFGNYLKGRLLSRELRALSPTAKKTKILTRTNKEVDVSNLGLVYSTLYKITRKFNSKEEIARINNDPEELGVAVKTAIIKNRFKPEIFNTPAGRQLADDAQDFARYGGKEQMDIVNGASMGSEKIVSDVERVAEELKQFGPSVALNVNTVEAMKGLKFDKQFGEISSRNDNFLLNWYFELHNTIGKKNGNFGNIVLWNIGKKESDVIDKLVEYSLGEGNEIAKKFGAFQAKGAQDFARNMYADITSALRDSAGRVNKNLVQAIRDKGGMDNFTLDDLVKQDKDWARPAVVQGKVIIPIGAGDQAGMVYRVINNGYGWIGRQIALLDREPIFAGNYFMYRKDFREYQNVVKERALAAGADEATADSMARLAAHDVATDAARTRTLGYVDNSDVRTNLAFSLRTFGRYYRATEDFYRRVARIGKYEKKALVRLAIVNQTFEHSGFVHKDDNGEMYFTYPGDDILNLVLGQTLNRSLGIIGLQPVPSRFGGKISMLTPSLDPQSIPPRLGSPLVSLSFSALEMLPYVGDYIKGVEKVVTGAYNVDAPWWRKATPINIQRAIDIINSGEAETPARFSAVIQAMRMNIGNGNGPTNPNEVDKFLLNSGIQAQNIQIIRFFSGLMTPASVQLLANGDMPKELIRAGAFTWDSEFQKFTKRYPNDPQVFQKALVDFAKIYPSKLVWAVSPTTAGTEFNFQKTYEAAQFVKDNKQLMLEHKQGASFFIPITGTKDYESYAYLKAQKLVKNKDVEDFLLEAATSEARKKYYEISDDYNARIAATNDVMQKRQLRQQLQLNQNTLKIVYPMLNTYLSTNTNSTTLKTNALNDLREVILTGKAPNAELSKTYSVMLYHYDKGMAVIDSNSGSSGLDKFNRKQARDDLKDILVSVAQGNPNAQNLYWTILEPLIGE